MSLSSPASDWPATIRVVRDGVELAGDLPFEFREVQDPELARRLQEIGRRMFLAIGATGYGRCDVRMNEAGELFILEINPNGGILYLPEEYGPADYMILYDADGYDGFFDRIFRSAIARQKLRSSQKV